MNLILFGLILVVTTTVTFAQQPSANPEKTYCPMDGSEIEYTPISFLGLKEAPAKITSTDSGMNIEAIKRVGLKNLSGKTIIAVKIKWFLYRVDRINNIITPRANPKIIMYGKTSIIKIEQLKPDEEINNINFSIASCQEIYDALVKDGDSEGEPWIEPAVIEISYSDGSKWTR